MNSVEDVLSELSRRGVMTVTRAPGYASLVESVVGGPVKGSWWAHPRGGEIYRLLTALNDHPDVLMAKLIAGKVTLVHRKLWPDLLRVLTDEGWRSERLDQLDAPARALLARVEAEGALRLDQLGGDRRALKKSRDQLESALLVHVDQEHTEKGRHENVLESWTRWMKRAGVRVDRRVSVD
ncbi:MAG: hypothetical protein WBV82_26900, partial [Myxococcaceae bacterium]